MNKRGLSRRQNKRFRRSSADRVVLDTRLIARDEQKFHLSLETLKALWDKRDWSTLCQIAVADIVELDTRAGMATLLSVAHMQQGAREQAKVFMDKALEWGVPKDRLMRILMTDTSGSFGQFTSLIEYKKPEAKPETTDVEGTSKSQATQPDIKKTETIEASAPDLSEVHKRVKSLEVSLKYVSQQVEAAAESRDVLLEAIKKESQELTNTIVKRAQMLEKSFTQMIVRGSEQIAAFQNISNYLRTGYLSPIGLESVGWPASSDFQFYLADLLVREGPYDLIVEFGSGVTTVVTAAVLANQLSESKGEKGGKSSARAPLFISFDHLEKYRNKTISELQRVGLNDLVEVCLAPLIPYQDAQGKEYKHYDCHETLLRIRQNLKKPDVELKILMVVDGPPGATCDHARYPALPVVMSVFPQAKMSVLLDDTVRQQEKDVADMWQKDLVAAQRFFTTETVSLEKGLTHIRVA
ncbi:hypothetical protein [Orrella sp. 11846]|uniref:hypothetical protein n=1 Tax=Orrella sp. 11846 TaxID=3409913 RepID=UPI003B5C2C57